jgi:hypothetical protein
MSAFDRSDRFQHELPEILTAIASPRVPDYVDDLLAQAAATRQRRRWTFLERWFPMGEIARERVYVPPVPWRPVLVAALLIVLAAAALLVVGSQQRVPPPFGPARNGAVVSGNGDIYLRDRIDGPARLVVGGPTDDFAASFTRDGRRLLFLRRTEGTSGSPNERLQMLAADRDGSNVVEITPPLVAPDWMDFAPDDGAVVLISGDPAIGQYLYIADLREPGKLRPLDVGDPPMSVSNPNFLGPTGAEIIFRGRAPGALGGHAGIFAIHPDGTGLRPITPTDGSPNDGYLFPQPSPDGRYVTYTSWDPVLTGNQIHLFDLQTGDDRIVTDVTRNQGYATFSPDSRQVIFVDYVRDRNQIMVAPVDGSAPPLAMGPIYRMVDDASVSGIFSPDGKWVVVTDSASGETRLVDTALGGDGELLPWSTADFSGWQRIAP